MVDHSIFYEGSHRHYLSFIDRETEAQPSEITDLKLLAGQWQSPKQNPKFFTEVFKQSNTLQIALIRKYVMGEVFEFNTKF